MLTPLTEQVFGYISSFRPGWTAEATQCWIMPFLQNCWTCNIVKPDYGCDQWPIPPLLGPELPWFIIKPFMDEEEEEEDWCLRTLKPSICME